MSEVEANVNDTSQERSLVSVASSSSHSGRHNSRSSMANHDSTLRILAFHGTRRDDAEKHWFMCEAIWSMKRVTNKASEIAQLETTFIDRALTWYMKYKATVSARKERFLTKIKRDLLREFQKPKLESQCITEIKEVKKQVGEIMWDYDQHFNILLEYRLTF
jgi:hypothetical protein